MVERLYLGRQAGSVIFHKGSRGGTSTLRCLIKAIGCLYTFEIKADLRLKEWPVI